MIEQLISRYRILEKLGEGGAGLQEAQGRTLFPSGNGHKTGW
jgi:hypothetical protein